MIFVLSALFGLCGCATDPFIKKLQNDIDQAPYSIEDYVLEEFDCSNMTNLLDDWLEQKGYDTKILVYYPIHPINDNQIPINKIRTLNVDHRTSNIQPHAILLVNNNLIVESVTKKVLKNKHPQDYIGALIFQDAESLLYYLSGETAYGGWIKEWGYERFLSNKFALGELSEK